MKPRNSVIIFLVGLFSFLLSLTYFADRIPSDPSSNNTDNDQTVVDTTITEYPTIIESALVTSVVDGDTLKLKIGENTETIRMIGINSPEKGACYFTEAKDRLTQLALDKEVKVELDPSQGERDKYDRLLAYIWVGDLNVNQEMLRGGFAREYTYDEPYKYQKEFREASSVAIKQNFGVHGTSCACEQNEELARSCTSCNTATVTFSNWDCTSYHREMVDTDCKVGCSEADLANPPVEFQCDCSKKCTQFAYCEEAQYQLEICGCTGIDGDGDGLACDAECG